MQHPGSIDMVALHAECVGIHDQLRPAVQTFRAEFEQRQTAQRGKRTALVWIQHQTVHRRDGFAVKEFRSQRAKTVVAVMSEPFDPG